MQELRTNLISVMLDSLHIKNYRNLRDFQIDSVDRINLITGKNNTGKSTVLEAIAIYASRGDFSQIYQLLNNRGEDFLRTDRLYRSFRDTREPHEIKESAVRSLSSMFTDRLVDFTGEGAISIGNCSHTKNIALRFVKYQENQMKLFFAEDENQEDYEYGFEIKSGTEVILVPFERLYRSGFSGFSNNEKFQFVRTANIDKEMNGKLFDSIALTEKEKYVIEALKIIEPNTERIAFVDENQGERTAVIKLSDVSKVFPLRSMGDGMNRILTIILALVNSENGYLLLDEFENGLHYTVQEQLWKIIFELSKRMNVQVFATTHSNDCISGFERVLNDSENTVSGKLIRLDNMAGTIKQVEFSSKEIEIAYNQNIEIR